MVMHKTHTFISQYHQGTIIPYKCKLYALNKSMIGCVSFLQLNKDETDIIVQSVMLETTDQA